MQKRGKAVSKLTPRTMHPPDASYACTKRTTHALFSQDAQYMLCTHALHDACSVNRYTIEDDLNEDSPAGTLIPFREPEGQTVECFISCELHPERARESPPKTKVILLDGDRNVLSEGAELEKLEVAGTEHRGVGMCVGPIFAESPQFLDWLTFWSKLGLKGIHAYVPLYDDDDPEVQKLGLGESYHRPHLSMHNLLSWTTYNPTPRSYYHDQKMAYNDCIYR